MTNTPLRVEAIQDPSMSTLSVWLSPPHSEGKPTSEATKQPAIKRSTRRHFLGNSGSGCLRAIRPATYHRWFAPYGTL
jgi:hypothetical protein